MTQTVWFCMEPDDAEVICEHDTREEALQCPEGDRADGWTINEHGDMTFHKEARRHGSTPVRLGRMT